VGKPCLPGRKRDNKKNYDGEGYRLMRKVLNEEIKGSVKAQGGEGGVREKAL